MRKYIFTKKLSVILNCVISLLGFASLLIMFYSYSLITDVVTNNDLEMALNVTIMVILVIATLLLFSIISVFTTRKIMALAVYNLRADIFNNTYNKSIYDFSELGQNYYSSAIINDVDMIEDKYFRPMLEIINDSLQILLMSMAISFIGIRYFIVIAILTIPTIIAPYILKKKLANQGVKLSKSMEGYSGITNETIDMYYVSKYFNKQKSIINRFTDKTYNLEEDRKKLVFTKSYNICINTIAVLLLKFVSLLYFTNSALNLLTDVSTVVLLFSLTNNIGNPINNILGYIESINSTKEIREKLIKIIEFKSHDSFNKTSHLSDDSTLNINNVTININEKNILNDFTFRFEQGKKYAIVGSSGSGKSSLFKLLLGYFDKYKGTINLGDIDIRDIPPEEIYKMISYVSQETFTFTDTIKNNICLLSEAFSDEQIKLAIEKANLKNLIDQLPDGINTVIDSDNITLSGGEKQRLAIARGLLYDTPIFILDEATSSLDNQTSMCIENNILSLSDKTIISIIHKMNDNILKYDCILVMDSGKVIAANNYKELRKDNPELDSLLDWRPLIENQ